MGWLIKMVIYNDLPFGYKKEFAMERSTIFKNGKPSINEPWIPWLC